MRRIATALLALAISPALAQAPSGTLTLLVRDGTTGRPVPASVSSRQDDTPISSTAGRDGRVSFTLSPGEHWFSVSAPGYKPFDTHFTVEPGKSYFAGTLMLDRVAPPPEESDAVLKALYRPGYTLLHEYVVDATGQPLPGVHIRLLNAHAEATTDHNGHFTLLARTPAPKYPDGPSYDNIVYEKRGYTTIAIHNFNVATEDMGGAYIEMKPGSGEDTRDGTHVLDRP